MLEDADGANDDENTVFLPGHRRRSDAQRFLAEQADQGQNFTLRGVSVGLIIGIVICFSNTYFGLQYVISDCRTIAFRVIPSFARQCYESY